MLRPKQTFAHSTYASLLAVASRASGAQTATRQWRIGVIGNAPPEAAPESARVWAAFLEALRERGYVEGKNIAFEMRFYEGKTERFPQLAAEIVRAKVDVIIVGSGPGVRAARQATVTTPIVMTSASDPVAAGVVATLSGR